MMKKNRIYKEENNSNFMLVYVFFVCLLLMVSSISLLLIKSETPEASFSHSELSSNQLKWMRRGIVNYSFLLNSNCHSAYDLLIEVRNGEPVWPNVGDIPNIEDLFR